MALKSFLKSKKSPDLVTLMAVQPYLNLKLADKAIVVMQQRNQNQSLNHNLYGVSLKILHNGPIKLI